MKRGYSLVAVLVALMLLMAVLVPLLGLQGRIHEAAFISDPNYLTEIEWDLNELKRDKTLPTKKTWQHDGFTIERTPIRKGQLMEVQYLVSEQGTTRYEVEVWVYPSRR